MPQKRPHIGWFLCLFVFSIPLFLGLFFGLNYPEIIRNGWPLTTCTVNNAALNTRYCCYSNCSSNCSNGGSGAQQCNDMINLVNNNYNPSRCAVNSTSCPLQIGSTCDGGYYCCGNCCSTCSSCTTSCSTGSPGSSQTCSQSCTSTQCNCKCCSSTSHRACTLVCPICYSVTLTLSYSPRDGPRESNVSYSQDFGQNQDQAEGFVDSHVTNSTARCYYNPKNLTQVILNVSFTAWKWAVTALFGMIPVLFFLFFTGYHYCFRPLQGCIRRCRGMDKGKERATRIAASVGNEGVQAMNVPQRPASSEPIKPPTLKGRISGNEDEAPPPYE